MSPHLVVLLIFQRKVDDDSIRFEKTASLVSGG